MLSAGVKLHKMQDMVAHGIQRRLLPGELRADVVPGHAAGLGDGTEHIIRQVAAVVPDGAAVGMSGDNGRPGDIHNIPEPLVADMADVDQHSQTLGFFHIRPPLIGQSAAGLMGAGQGILFVPAKAGNTEADEPKAAQQLRVISDSRCSFQRQDGGHLSVLPVFFNFLRGIGNGNQILVLVHFPLKRGDFPLKGDDGRHMVVFFHERRGEAGKALGIAPQPGRPLQIDMEAVLPQAARLIHIVAQKCKRCITMQVDHRKIH